MKESALLQIISWCGVLLGSLIAFLTYRAITKELKRPEPDSSLTSSLWLVVAAGLGLGLLGLWVQLKPRDSDAKASQSPATSDAKTGAATVASGKVESQGLISSATSTNAVAELSALKAKLAKMEANLAKYRGLQNAFAQNREKWRDVLDKAGVIAGQLRPDVQSELKAIRDQLGVKLVEETE